MTTGRFLPACLFLLVACSGEAGNSANQATPEAEMPPGVAEMAEDPALADEAAADEAADIENFGGNAAAMDANAQ